MEKKDLEWLSVAYQVMVCRDYKTIDMCSFPSNIAVYEIGYDPWFEEITVDELKEIFAYCPQNEGKKFEDVWSVTDYIKFNDNFEATLYGKLAVSTKILNDLYELIGTKTFCTYEVSTNEKKVSCLAFNYSEEFSKNLKNLLHESEFEMYYTVDEKGERSHIETNIPYDVYAEYVKSKYGVYYK